MLVEQHLLSLLHLLYQFLLSATALHNHLQCSIVFDATYFPIKKQKKPLPTVANKLARWLSFQLNLKLLFSQKYSADDQNR